MSGLTPGKILIAEADDEARDATAAELTALCNAFVGDSGSGGTKGMVPAPSAGDAAAKKYLKADGTWDAVDATDIADGMITNAKLANVSTATIKGRTTAGTGAPEDLTVTQATALLNAMVGDSGAGGTKGLVPAPASGDAAAGKYLKANGTWVDPIAAMLAATNIFTGTYNRFNNAVMFGGTDVGLVRQSANALKVTADTAGSTNGDFYAAIINATSFFVGNGSQLTALNASSIASGTIGTARLGSGSATASTFLRGDGTWADPIAALNASNLSSGTVPDARFPATLPAASGINLTALNASNIASGSLADARLSANVTVQGNTFNAASKLLQLSATTRARVPALDLSFVAQVVTADVNNLTAPNGFLVHITNSSGASKNITGMAPSIDPDTFLRQGGYIFSYENSVAGSAPVVLKHASASSTAANRFLCPGSVDFTLTAQKSCFIYYENVSGGRWVVQDISVPYNTTVQGNTFNGASQLVQLSAGSALPAVDGSALTNLPPANAETLTGTYIPFGISGTYLTHLSASALEGSLPAIDGSALTGVVDSVAQGNAANAISKLGAIGSVSTSDPGVLNGADTVDFGSLQSAISYLASKIQALSTAANS